jgi:RsiW-degrading membrane proteinase PrsW (M82 family)
LLKKTRIEKLNNHRFPPVVFLFLAISYDIVMSIQLQCSNCRKSLKAPESFAGKTARCPNCKQQIVIPAAIEPPEPEVYYILEDAVARDDNSLSSKVEPPPIAPQAAVFALRSSELPPAKPVAEVDANHLPEPEQEPAGATSQGRGLYYIFALMLLPLVVSIIRGRDHMEVRLMRTLEAHPEIKSRIAANGEEFSMKDFFAALPDGRIEGAHLAYGTWNHWYYAIAAAAFFGLASFALFPQGNAQWKHILLIPVGTATFGIVFLISLQWIAAFAQGWIVSRSLIIMIVYYILYFIGFSYRAAMDPNSGFLLSMLGFTFGVGLCEELTKALPVAFHFRSNPKLDWQGACIWGLVSGVGFGIAEGIMYSSDFYNGLASVETYIVRFIPCVAMHAIWTASAAIMIWRRRDWFAGESEWSDLLVSLLWVLAVPMTLHGLYDTLLKREMEGLALLTALASFAWLAFLIEWTRTSDESKSYAH